ncbi:hypothetical protein NMY22_g3891 [Coprinellus aureogranulatus]|nr:hypothetical protein NMY22_g3891 [Coprinellus aureogranulatus]
MPHLHFIQARRQPSPLPHPALPLLLLPTIPALPANSTTPLPGPPSKDKDAQYAASPTVLVQLSSEGGKLSYITYDQEKHEGGEWSEVKGWKGAANTPESSASGGNGNGGNLNGANGGEGGRTGTAGTATTRIDFHLFLASVLQLPPPSEQSLHPPHGRSPYALMPHRNLIRYVAYTSLLSDMDALCRYLLSSPSLRLLAFLSTSYALTPQLPTRRFSSRPVLPRLKLLEVRALSEKFAARALLEYLELRAMRLREAGERTGEGDKLRWITVQYKFRSQGTIGNWLLDGLYGRSGEAKA